ncbi:potassium voltage-gated channel protein Shaw-like isoform X3 [Mya arenaria]|uniref:potassium voltage-gated channel protein Shaw-like isoform X3 n=1 Tax=Mya arenaria TaxID=6604 RepID=UPI0022E29105|nr:potassium voltage-gated channel protein Shaw-like isoform X3 [Mya arenaria]
MPVDCEYSLIDKQPRTKNSAVCRSPNLGSRSPSPGRSGGRRFFGSSEKSKLQRNRFGDSEYTPRTPDCFDRGSRNSETLSIVGHKHNGGLSPDGYTDNVLGYGGDRETTGVDNAGGNMALSAVMMSGGGGGNNGGGGMKQCNSHYSVSDLQHGDGTIWTLSNTSEIDLSRSWPGSQTPNKCNCDKIRSKETVIINVGGQVFETFRSTLKRLRSCKLASEQEMMRHYRQEKGDFFFDRDPYAFNIIINYLRYGNLHLPTNLCGPTLMREFEYWGIDEGDIERCCFQPYNTWKTQTKSLEKLEYDRKQSTTQTDLAQDRHSKSCWRRIRAVIWPFLQDPGSSRAAKIYAWVSIIFVCMSIFSFCAETHPYFQLPPSEVHSLRSLYKLFTLEHSKVFHEISKSDVTSLPDSNNTNSTGVNNIFSDTETETDETTIQHPALLIMDLMCVLFFTIEFLTRLVFCPKKRRFCSSLQNIIDFIAIVPDYVEFILLCFSPQVRAGGLGFVDFIFILRMLRLCRIFRLIRHVPGLWILLYTLKASFNELLLMFVFLLIGMVMFASLLHFTEGGEQFSNIPVGFWWAVVTMTTVGYGDMVPVTGFGYVIGSICAISGLLMIAFTVPIIVSNFVLYYTHVQYGLSDKDDVAGRICDVSDEVETCSFHTSCTETSEDLRKKQEAQLEKTVSNSKLVEGFDSSGDRKPVPLTSSVPVLKNVETNEKTEDIPMFSTEINGNTNKL